VPNGRNVRTATGVMGAALTIFTCDTGPALVPTAISAYYWEHPIVDVARKGSGLATPRCRA
jgi:hypothetical protein